MLQLTIDTSIVAEEGSVLEYLKNGHQTGLFDVAVSSRFRMDKENDQDLERLERHRKIAAHFNITPSTFTLGNIEDNEIGLLPDEEEHSQLFCLFDVNETTRGGRHSRCDIDHIYSHLVAGRDIFLTFEKRVLKKRAILSELNINVTHPEIFVEAAKQASSIYFHRTVEFEHALQSNIDILHPAKMNPVLLSRLRAMRQAQEDVRLKRFTPDDEKIVKKLVQRHRAYHSNPLEDLDYLVRRGYHQKKFFYLFAFPSQQITINNVVRGITRLYPRIFTNIDE
jgi:hypothetical protein